MHHCTRKQITQAKICRNLYTLTYEGSNSNFIHIVLNATWWMEQSHFLSNFAKVF